MDQECKCAKNVLFLFFLYEVKYRRMKALEPQGVSALPNSLLCLCNSGPGQWLTLSKNCSCWF